MNARDENSLPSKDEIDKYQNNNNQNNNINNSNNNNNNNLINNSNSNYNILNDSNSNNNNNNMPKSVDNNNNQNSKSNSNKNVGLATVASDDDNDALNSLEEFTYSNRYQHDVNEGDQCLICYTKFNKDDIVQKLQCGHFYHKYCLKRFNQNQVKNENYPVCLICLQWELQDQINRRN